MNLAQQTVTMTKGTDSTVHLFITKGHAELMPGDAEHVREDVWLRAMTVGPVLEGILAETHDEQCWK